MNNAAESTATHELVLIDPETGEEEELVCFGSLESMSEHAADMVEQAQDDGYDIPWIRVQPAA
jgi:hypothetical protein